MRHVRLARSLPRSPLVFAVFVVGVGPVSCVSPVPSVLFFYDHVINLIYFMVHPILGTCTI